MTTCARRSAPCLTWPVAAVMAAANEPVGSPRGRRPAARIRPAGRAPHDGSSPAPVSRVARVWLSTTVKEAAIASIAHMG